MGEKNFRSDVDLMLSELKLKFKSKYQEKLTPLEKCHKIGELMISDIYSNPNSVFKGKYQSNEVYRRVENCYNLQVSSFNLKPLIHEILE